MEAAVEDFLDDVELGELGHTWVMNAVSKATSGVDIRRNTT